MVDPDKMNAVRLSTRGKIVVNLIQQAYEKGDSVEDIAHRFGLEVDQVQFLTTLNTLQQEQRSGPE